MAMFVLLILVGFQTKHFVADYLLQPQWMIAGKSSLRKPGGYVHAGIHALGSLIVLLAAGIPMSISALLIPAEAVAHFLIDYGKALWSRTRPANVAAASYWAAHGADQLMHQITYALMIYAVLATTGDF